MAIYSSKSSYYDTQLTQFYLGPMVNRAIPKEPDDNYVKINQTYQYRPDLLAYDLYGDPTLWWVFYQRNPNNLVAPPWDFEIGREIYVPKLSTLREVLGF